MGRVPAWHSAPTVSKCQRGLDGTLKVWDILTGQVILRIKGEWCLRVQRHVHPVSEYLASTGEQAGKSLGLDDKRLLPPVRSPSDSWLAYTVAFNPPSPTNSRWAAKAATIWTGKTMSVHLPAQETQRISVAAIRRSTIILASGNWGGSVKLWNAKDRRELPAAS
jgi:WD40 repeat protein